MQKKFLFLANINVNTF